MLSHTYSIKIRGMEHLYQRIQDKCTIPSFGFVICMLNNMRFRFQMYVELDGAHTEHILWSVTHAVISPMAQEFSDTLYMKIIVKM